MNLVIAIFILGFIVFVHEFGHFLFAKIFKVPVSEFSIGMGPRIFSFIKNNTRYSLKALPFGGSCAMVGEDLAGSGDFKNIGGNIDEENRTIDFDGVKFSFEEVEKNNFQAINPIKKVIICIAGPAFNIILGFICCIFLISMAGVNRPVIKKVVEGSSAYNASMQINEGDIIKKMATYGDSEIIHLTDQVNLFMFMNSDMFKQKDVPVVMTLDRNGAIFDTVIYPIYNESENRFLIGISVGESFVPNNIFDFIKYSIYESGYYITSTVKSLKMLIYGKFSANDISGPVGTVAIMGSAIKSANNIKIFIIMVLSLVSLISINLAIMNLIPIPALDGGRILEAAIEMIIGKRLDEKIVGAINVVTMGMLLIFMVWIFGIDIYKVFTGVYN